MPRVVYSAASEKAKYSWLHARDLNQRSLSERTVQSPYPFAATNKTVIQIRYSRRGTSIDSLRGDEHLLFAVAKLSQNAIVLT
jgi:hypothetical protein